MSHSCHSKIVVGVKINLETVVKTKVFKRFDPKTGNPVEHTGTVFDVALSYAGYRFDLPEDETTMEESQVKWQYDYLTGNLYTKLYNFMKDYDIDEDYGKGVLSYFINLVSDLHPLGQRSNKDHVVVGITIAEGSSNNPVVEVPNTELLETYKKQFIDETLELQKQFGVFQPSDVKFFLMT